PDLLQDALVPHGVPLAERLAFLLPADLGAVRDGVRGRRDLHPQRRLAAGRQLRARIGVRAVRQPWLRARTGRPAGEALRLGPVGRRRTRKRLGVRTPPHSWGGAERNEAEGGGRPPPTPLRAPPPRERGGVLPNVRLRGLWPLPRCRRSRLTSWRPTTAASARSPMRRTVCPARSGWRPASPTSAPRPTSPRRPSLPSTKASPSTRPLRASPLCVKRW